MMGTKVFCDVCGELQQSYDISMDTVRPVAAFIKDYPSNIAAYCCESCKPKVLRGLAGLLFAGMPDSDDRAWLLRRADEREAALKPQESPDAN